MTSPLLIAALISASALGQNLNQDSYEQQNESFQRWWASDFEWRFDQLPLAAGVDEERAPYSGYIYPDTAGGTAAALYKYDQAFNRGTPATLHERRDTSITEPVRRTVTHRGGGLFFRRAYSSIVTYNAVPHWYGHCNGWTAAAIRHAEPRNSVRQNGVLFTPADIKGLLAEIYIYNEHEVFVEGPISPGMLHALVANWVGRMQHPIGMEADPGREKWNYPVYRYEANAYNRTTRGVDVQMRFTFAMNSNVEYQESPRLPRIKYFNYHLYLGNDSKILGGYYHRGSSQIDMLWVPLSPKDPGKKGNERGNPHVDIDTVLALWRQSVPEELRDDWAIIDPLRPGEDEVPGAAPQLAERESEDSPDTVAEPPASPSPSADSQPDARLAMRLWVNQSGSRSAEARLIAIFRGEAWFMDANQKRLRVSLNRLSEEDQVLIERARRVYGEGMIASSTSASRDREEGVGDTSSANSADLAEVGSPEIAAVDVAGDAEDSIVDDTPQPPASELAGRPRIAQPRAESETQPAGSTNRREIEELVDADAEPAAQPTPEIESTDQNDSEEEPFLTMRRWVDDSGNFAIEGRLIAILNGEAWFARSNGGTSRARIERLSDADRAIVEAAREQFGTGRFGG